MIEGARGVLIGLRFVPFLYSVADADKDFVD